MLRSLPKSPPRFLTVYLCDHPPAVGRSNIPPEELNNIVLPKQDGKLLYQIPHILHIILLWFRRVLGEITPPVSSSLLYVGMGLGVGN